MGHEGPKKQCGSCILSIKCETSTNDYDNFKTIEGRNWRLKARTTMAQDRIFFGRYDQKKTSVVHTVLLSGHEETIL